MEFLDFCDNCLRELLRLQDVSAAKASRGVTLTELSQSLFEDAANDPDFFNSTRGAAVVQASKALMRLGIVVPDPGQILRIPRTQRDRALNFSDSWRFPITESLDSEEERILRALNRRSERREKDHAYLEKVSYEDLYSDLEMQPGPSSEGRLIKLMQDLRQLDLVSILTADLTVRADIDGLVWERRKDSGVTFANLLSSTERSDIGGADGQMLVNPIWRGRDQEVDDTLCFVLMPFKEPFDTIYVDHIKPVVEGISGVTLQCKRADDIYRVGMFMEDIWNQTCRARFLIAELTGRNPNVFYELGIAHTIGKDVILLTQDSNDVPADLKHHRYIEYSPTLRGPKLLEQKLTETILTILHEGD